MLTDGDSKNSSLLVYEHASRDFTESREHEKKKKKLIFENGQTFKSLLMLRSYQRN